MESRLGAASAAVAHGLASRLVVPQAGLVASDLLPAIQRVLDGEAWELP
jgi:NAD(P)H-hydrate repair Nnr-like enzyme with NAD(P)H-hydrate dehydratase domain